MRHLLHLGDEVSEELCHVLLLAGVQRLFVHRVGLTERPRVVRLPLALLEMRHWTETTERQELNCGVFITIQERPVDPP